ncbi:MAG: indolepyruvate oxidoreductase subunit beta [Deltaproteobacteria bacterium]|nr:indolepyruvate oxidoreductase subunit beta [Deltaproteobacteria bacterium]
MADVVSILLVGVGGQGILKASDILAEALMFAGYDVKKSEVHGMAQRGGSVSSFVRFGKSVYSPTAAKGTAGILLSFEKLETLRYLDNLMPDGKIIINNESINPPACNLGSMEYPKNIEYFVGNVSKNVKYVSASEIAVEAGNIRCANTVLLGSLANHLPLISGSIWKKVLTKSFPEKLLDLNLRAFELGKSA